MLIFRIDTDVDEVDGAGCYDETESGLRDTVWC